MSCSILQSSSVSRRRGAAAHPLNGTRPAPQASQQAADFYRHRTRIVPVQAFASIPRSFSPHLGIFSGDRLCPNRRNAYDVVGLGEAMVDYSGMVSSEYLDQIGVEAGGRRCAPRKSRLL
jgi:hypothetical protein